MANSGKREQTQIGIQFSGRHQGLTLTLMLFCVYREGPIMNALQNDQPAAKRVRCRYLHETNREKLANIVVELEKSWKKPRRRVTP